MSFFDQEVGERGREGAWVNRMRGGSAVRLVVGLAAITLGLLYFLDNLYVIDARPLLKFWPSAVLLGIGAATFAQARRLTWAAGLWLFAGVWHLLDTLRLTDIGFWDAAIPVGLVLLGVNVLRRALSGTPNRPRSGAGGTAVGPFGSSGWFGRTATDPAADRSAVGADGTVAGSAAAGDSETSFQAMAVMAGIRRSSSSQALRRIETMAVMGGVEIDLTHAAPPPGEAVEVDAFTIWGSIEIWVPPHWAVELQPVALMAGVEDNTVQRYTTPGPVDASRPRLVVRGFALMAGIEIKNRRSDDPMAYKGPGAASPPPAS
jgi:hypothetical protein